MTVYTIGFTRKSAEQFFETLKNSGVKRVVDVRLKNLSQLAGFSKRDDLRYFLKRICGLDYLHIPLLAPTEVILSEYKGKKGDWVQYEERFFALMGQRAVETQVSQETMDGACLLCSEETARHCHRRLVAEYLAQKWGEVQIVHL